MAVTYSGADFRSLGDQTQPRMVGHDIVCLHTMAGSLAGTDTMFKERGYGGTESHFGVGGNGELVQWQDLEFSADANYKGSNHIVSIETADKGSPFKEWSGTDVPAWTDKQLATLAKLIAWLCGKYKIPLELIPDSAPGRRGIGYHRQGCDPWRVPDGERWSTVVGKVCPGDRRIAQIPKLIERARLISGDGMTAKFEADVRRMWAGMTDGGLAAHVAKYDAMEADLRADLAVKAEQLTHIRGTVRDIGEQMDRIEGKLDQLLSREHPEV